MAASSTRNHKELILNLAKRLSTTTYIATYSADMFTNDGITYRDTLTIFPKLSLHDFLYHSWINKFYIIYMGSALTPSTKVELTARTYELISDIFQYPTSSPETPTTQP